MAITKFVSTLVAMLALHGAAAFQVTPRQAVRSATSSLDAVSRREAMGAVAGAMLVAGVAPMEAMAAAAPKPQAVDTSKYSFNGVFKDPNHPNGYRILAGAINKEGTMTLQDAPGEKTFDIPFESKKDEETGDISLQFDFSVKGGPKKIVAKVNKDTVVFPDGNTWKKETSGVIGVYVDGFAPYPKYRRIIREGDGNNIVVDMVSGKKKFEVLGSTNKKGVIIDFPGDKRCNGTFNNKKGTIKYPDGNIWTRV